MQDRSTPSLIPFHTVQYMYPSPLESSHTLVPLLLCHVNLKRSWVFGIMTLTSRGCHSTPRAPDFQNNPSHLQIFEVLKCLTGLSERVCLWDRTRVFGPMIPPTTNSVTIS